MKQNEKMHQLKKVRKVLELAGLETVLVSCELDLRLAIQSWAISKWGQGKTIACDEQAVYVCKNGMYLAEAEKAGLPKNIFVIFGELKID